MDLTISTYSQLSTFASKKHKIPQYKHKGPDNNGTDGQKHLAEGHVGESQASYGLPGAEYRGLRKNTQKGYIYYQGLIVDKILNNDALLYNWDIYSQILSKCNLSPEQEKIVREVKKELMSNPKSGSTWVGTGSNEACQKRCIYRRSNMYNVSYSNLGFMETPLPDPKLKEKAEAKLKLLDAYVHNKSWHDKLSVKYHIGDLVALVRDNEDADIVIDVLRNDVLKTGKYACDGSFLVDLLRENIDISLIKKILSNKKLTSHLNPMYWLRGIDYNDANTQKISDLLDLFLEKYGDDPYILGEMGRCINKIVEDDEPQESVFWLVETLSPKREEYRRKRYN